MYRDMIACLTDFRVEFSGTGTVSFCSRSSGYKKTGEPDYIVNSLI